MSGFLLPAALVYFGGGIFPHFWLVKTTDMDEFLCWMRARDKDPYHYPSLSTISWAADRSNGTVSM